MNLYGKTWTRRELEARVGRVEQIAGAQRFVLQDGPEAGVEAFRVRTGAGLSYWITPTKGMDISLAEMHGVPVSWQSGNGEAHPSAYDSEGAEWLRTASGGLLMTCGMTQVGGPGEDAAGKYGLHGRVHHTPARQTSVWAEWEGDEYVIRVRGVVEETSIFGDTLRLTRTIASRMGDNRIEIEDEVENAGFRESPHMMLYHFNFGFPLLAEDTTIEPPSEAPVPREAGDDVSRVREWAAPDASFQEQVYYYGPFEGERTLRATIHSPSFPARSASSGTAGLKVELAWDGTTLPRMVQWRMPGAKEHVLGLEPSNCWVGGRAKEREAGTLVTLAPGQTVRYRLALSFD